MIVSSERGRVLFVMIIGGGVWVGEGWGGGGGVFFFQAEDGIRDLVRSRGLGDVYKRQVGRVSALNCCMSASGA